MIRKGAVFIILLLTFAVTLPGYGATVLSDTVPEYPELQAYAEIYSPLGPDLTAPEPELPDTIASRTGTYVEDDWRYRLHKGDFKHLLDPEIHWPRFVGFCLDVYRWADRVFNSHDTLYVKGDGRHGKVLLISDNWMDSYYFDPRTGPDIKMLGDIYANLGVNLKYSGMSVGYSVDMNSVFGHKPSNHKKWDFGFSCARFNIEIHLWKNEGGTYVRGFGDYDNGNLLRMPFDGLSFKAWDLHGYYLFNNRKFSMGAAYNYSFDQRKSAGTAIIGFDISSYFINFDFTKLPPELLDYYPYPLDSYRFDYRSYTLIGGYSYNWVLNKHFLLNVTLFPGIGISSSRQDSSRGRDVLAALNIKNTNALIYNYKQLFCCLKTAFTGNFFLTDDIKFFSNIQNYQLAIGLRF